MVTCSNCGTRNTRDVAFCTNCGAFLEWTGEVPAQPPPDPVGPSGPVTPGAPTPTQSGGPPATPPPATGTYVAPSAVVESSTLAVDPGEEVSVRVDVANRSGIVDQYAVEVGDVPREWVDVAPATLSLFPDDRGSFVVRFRPPRASSTPPGPMAFRLHVISAADPSIRTTVDGVLEIGTFQELTAELTPYTSRGRTAGQHTVSVTNAGNDEVPTILTGKNPDNLVRFRLKPDAVRVPAGGTARAVVAVRPRKWRWFSGGHQHAFQITAQPDAGNPLTVQGMMEQSALLPGWAPRLAIGLVVLAATGGLLKATVFTGETEKARSTDQTTIASQVVTTAGLPPTVATTATAGPTTVPATTLPGNTTTLAPTTSSPPTTLAPPKVIFVSTREDRGLEQIWTMNTDGSNAVKLTSPRGHNTQPSFSPDRQTIAFVSGRDGNDELYRMDADGRNARRLTNDPAKDNYPRWSPDGKRIVFARSPNPAQPDSDLFVLDVATLAVVNITNSPNVSDTKPTWSADGRFIAWERAVLGGSNPTNVFIQQIAGDNAVSNARQLVAGGRHPAFSPADTTKIAFSNGTDIFSGTVPPNGPITAPIALTANAGRNVDPWWEPNGSRLVFVSLRDQNEEVYIMAANGTDQKRLTATSTGTPPDASQDRFPQI